LTVWQCTDEGMKAEAYHLGHHLKTETVVIITISLMANVEEAAAYR